MIKKVFFCCVLVLMSMFLTCKLMAQYGNEDSIVGIWLTEKKDSKIQILKSSDGTFFGKIVWTTPEYRAFEQMLIIKDISYNSKEGNYKSPWVYSPRKKISAKATLIVKDNTLYIKATKALISVTEQFTRVK